MSDPMTRFDVAATLTIHPVEGGGCRIVPDNEFNFEVQNDDEIRMVRPLPAGEEWILHLVLSPGTGAQIRALSFGTTSDEALNAEQVRDTGGGYYGTSPFKLAPGPTGTLFLTVANPRNERRFKTELWYFDVWPGGGGPIHRIDPKIYNEGDDPPPRR